MMRLFLISLGVTCLLSVVLFLYFRNRIGRTEKKVELMFQLIQEYEQSKNIMQRQNLSPGITKNEIIHQTKRNENHDDLISVSDDDDRDSDSEEISDSESLDEEQINIEESLTNVKSISLSGAEIESLTVEPLDDLDDISDLDDNEVVTLEEVTGEESVSENPEILENEIVEDVTNNVLVKKIEEAVKEKPLEKMTVKELKAKAEKDGYTNFKGLRKDKLVQLLTNQ